MRDGGIAYNSRNYRKIGNILQSYGDDRLDESDKIKLQDFSKKAIEINVSEDDKDTWNLRMFELDQEVNNFIYELDVKMRRKKYGK